MKPTIQNIWLESNRDWQENPMSIRLDWSNDRHHRVIIEYPFDNECVFHALERLAQFVIQDRGLD